MRRPAETAGGAVGVGGIIAGLASHNALAAVLAAAGLVPGAVTFVVAHGGVSGVARLVWRGRSSDENVAVLEQKPRRRR